MEQRKRESAKRPGRTRWWAIKHKPPRAPGGAYPPGLLIIVVIDRFVSVRGINLGVAADRAFCRLKHGNAVIVNNRSRYSELNRYFIAGNSESKISFSQPLVFYRLIWNIRLLIECSILSWNYLYIFCFHKCHTWEKIYYILIYIIRINKVPEKILKIINNK